jgi:hypothetical protein
VQTKPIVLVSSSVYQNKSLLEQIYATLTKVGYMVWMSHKGTIPVFSRQSNFDNCLKAVERCDIFLGVITPYYGSGRMPDGKTITHHELLKAIELDKLRWIVADYRVSFARQILRQYRFKQNNKLRSTFRFGKTAVLDGIGVIQMYEDATRSDVNLVDRTGNWVHEYHTEAEALFYIGDQFRDVDRVRQYLQR